MYTYYAEVTQAKVQSNSTRGVLQRRYPPHKRPRVLMATAFVPPVAPQQLSEGAPKRVGKAEASAAVSPPAVPGPAILGSILVVRF